MSNNNRKFYVNRYIPKYVQPNLKWYERDGLLTSIDCSKYEQFERNRDTYLKNAEIINFDIIHHLCRGDKLEGSYRQYRIVLNSHVDNMPSEDKKLPLATYMRCPRHDLYVQRDLMISYFKTLQ